MFYSKVIPHDCICASFVFPYYFLTETLKSDSNLLLTFIRACVTVVQKPLQNKTV